MRYGKDLDPKDLDGKYLDWHPMWGNMGTSYLWIHALLALITWILLIAVLFALFRWLWFKGNEENKRRK